MVERDARFEFVERDYFHEHLPQRFRQSTQWGSAVQRTIWCVTEEERCEAISQFRWLPSRTVLEFVGWQMESRRSGPVEREAPALRGTAAADPWPVGQGSHRTARGSPAPGVD